MTALKQADGVPIKRACEALGVSRATLYRCRHAKIPSTVKIHRRRPPRKLDDRERATIVDVLHSAEFADQPPREVYGTLLSRGIYLGSVRTMYRVLASLGEVRERRMQRAPQRWAAPSLEATGPNMVWTWDITKLRGPTKGIFYNAYVVIDLFSRYVVAWMVERTENGALAEQLFTEAFARHGITRDMLTAHSDRGAPMTSIDIRDLFSLLGVVHSLGRPRVSNDNAFSESQFRTLKYQPDYPARFESLEHARVWMQNFITWYNDQHCHVGLALFTPADVFLGRVQQIAETRQAALDASFDKNPERFVSGRPLVALPASVVKIDPDQLHRARTIRCQVAASVEPVGDVVAASDRPAQRTRDRAAVKHHCGVGEAVAGGA